MNIMPPKVVMVRAHPIDPDVRIEKEAKRLSKAGYDVTILGWGRYGKNSLKEESRSGYSIRRFQFKAPWGVRVIFYLPFWWIFEFIWLLRNKWDIVHAADLDTLIPALIAARIKNKPILYDIFDFYADQVPLPRLFKNLVKNLDRCLMNFVDVVIIVDPSRRKQVGGEHDVPTMVIYNSPSDDLRVDIPTVKNKNNIFRIFYAGVLTPDRDFRSLVDASVNLDDVTIEIAGYGYYEEEIKELSIKCSRLAYLGSIKYDTVIKKTCGADLLFALYDPNVPNNRYASPNKLFEAMMCGKPILVSDNTAMAEIVRKEECGLVVPYGDVEVITHAIVMLKNDPVLCKHLGENGRKAYETKYSWEIMGERLLDVYRGLDPEQRQGSGKAHSSSHVVRYALLVEKSFRKLLGHR